MGIDINLNIIDHLTGEYILEDFYPGRCREWFDDLCDRGHSKEYDYLNPLLSYGIPKEVPRQILEDFNSHDYWDFHFIKVKDFMKWFIEFRPDRNAGWVTTYDKWLYDTKGIVPDEVAMVLPEADNRDWVFLEYTNENDQSLWLDNILFENEDIGLEDYIVFYFG